MIEKIKKFFSRPKSAAGPRPSRRILTIDDDVNQRTFIVKILTQRGHSVLIAENGAKGLEMALREKPDLILLDAVMPGMQGEEVCQQLKSHSQTKDIPVIFLSSQNSPRDVITHYDLGADIHLTKPINAKELVTEVEISLGLK